MIKRLRLGMKRVLHWVGTLLALAGVVFVVLRLRDYGAQINFTRLNGALGLKITVLALLYGLANVMLAFAWWNLLMQFGSRPSRRWALKTYGISQLAKYVPGNIFHLAGRQAMGMAEGISGWVLARSSIWELGLISLTGSTFGFLALPLILPQVEGSLAAGIFGIVVCLAGLATGRYLGVWVARAFIYYVGYLAVSGLLFVAITGTVTNADLMSLPWMGLASAYVVAWLCGLLTPGAPAGVGVREFVLLFLLKGLVNQEDLLLTIVLGRLVTVLGDAVFWFVSTLYRPQFRPDEKRGRMSSWVF